MSKRLKISIFCLSFSFLNYALEAGQSGKKSNPLVGSWHASSSVGAGYNERFVFFADGRVIFYSSQYKADRKYLKLEGTWRIINSKLEIKYTSQLDLKNKKTSAGENLQWDFHPPEKVKPDEAPEYITEKILLQGKYFFKFSDDTRMWENN